MIKTSHLVYALLVVLCGALLIGWFSVLTPLFDSESDALRTIYVAGNAVHVSVADTEAAREQGLSGRAGLAPDEGMLFIFPVDGQYAFWMKDMLFSIDMVWLTADGHIVYIAPNVAPSTYPSSFTSPTPARYVLELPANYMTRRGVKVGDVVQL